MAKIVIIGLGHVGLSYLEKLVFDKSISGEVVLIDKDVKEEKKIYLENNNSVVMKSIISNSTIPFKDNTYLLNKFL